MSSPDIFREVRVRAPGKINLLLAVGPLRTDGYHSLASVFQAVSLYEEIHAHSARELSVEFTGPIDTSGLHGNDTLVHRAARLVAQELDEDARQQLVGGTADVPGIRIVVDKHVPIAGGMGGGSADAAATLLACNAVWDAQLSTERLLDLAAQLGADVPFALQGSNAIGLDRGDRLTPVVSSGTFHWVLVPQHSGLSTPAVYAELDRLRQRAEKISSADLEVPEELLRALRGSNADALAATLRNDLEAAAFSLDPSLAARAQQLSEFEGVCHVLVSGSGPTLAALCESAERAELLHAALRVQGIESFAVHGPVPGARFVHEVPGSGGSAQ